VFALLQTSATSAPLYPQKSNFFSSPLSLCFTSPSLLHVCLSPSVSVSVSSAPLSLPYPLIQPLTPYFSHTRSPLSLCFTFLSLSPSVSGAALPSFDCYSISLSSYWLFYLMFFHSLSHTFRLSTSTLFFN
jgi:hypothetical protein